MVIYTVIMYTYAQLTVACNTYYTAAKSNYSVTPIKMSGQSFQFCT